MLEEERMGGGIFLGRGLLRGMKAKALKILNLKGLDHLKLSKDLPAFFTTVTRFQRQRELKVTLYYSRGDKCSLPASTDLLVRKIATFKF